MIQFKYQIWCAQAANVFVARDGASVLLEMADVYANGSKGTGDARRKIARRPARLTRAGGGAGARVRGSCSGGGRGASRGAVHKTAVAGWGLLLVMQWQGCKCTTGRFLLTRGPVCTPLQNYS